MLTLSPEFRLLFFKGARICRPPRKLAQGWVHEARDKGEPSAWCLWTLAHHQIFAGAAVQDGHLKPDVVLFSLDPGASGTSVLMTSLVATGLSSGRQRAIYAARGRVEPRHVDGTSHFVHAVVKLPSGFQANLGVAYG